MVKSRSTFQTFIKAIWAGILIGIACIANLSVGGGVIGAISFCIGLLAIVHSKLSLYTGMIGKTVYNPLGGEKMTALKLVVALVGNIVGTFLMSLVLRFTRLNYLVGKAEEIAISKLNDSYISILLLATLCGVLVYLAVYKFQGGNITDLAVLLFCVAVFVIIGFEHSIASSFYFFFSLNWKAFLYFLLMVLGNSLGSCVIAGAIKQNSK